MVKTQSEDIEMENLKHNHEVELLQIKEELSIKEHERKLQRLAIHLQIAECTGKKVEED